MNTKLALSALVAALMLTACAKQESASTDQAATPPAPAAPAASDSSATPPASGAAAVPDAGGVAEESEAAGAAGAGGVAAWSVLADSCFAQAVSISAATSALRASFVFIDRYPERSKSCVDVTTTAHGRSAPRPGRRDANSIEIPLRLETRRRLESKGDGAAVCCRAEATAAADLYETGDRLE